ncbi:rRNA adenine N-6-methyltransferase family protein [uncultured Methylovirgula sp.]|uniref:class I SAM-dependent methyltransferase n=1 Tax=uncultured Methylovirgula sp. TaxID=1285960 RepID=UPI00262C4952|nr:rRNA adenine N-6-methyltransferase family protein [uncultured Methylovirgula sp.]
MSLPPPTPQSRFADAAQFLRTWAANPLLLGAVTPSGPALAAAMAAEIDPAQPGPVIELGPGTGVMTEALLERGIAPERLFLIEYEPGFCDLLRARFPGVTVLQGDAYALRATLGARLRQAPIAVVSSLPLITRPEAQRAALVAEAFDLMVPNGPFVQFSYSLFSPVPLKLAPPHRLTTSPWIWRNVPPARVWIYRTGVSA